MDGRGSGLSVHGDYVQLNGSTTVTNEGALAITGAVSLLGGSLVASGDALFAAVRNQELVEGSFSIVSKDDQTTLLNLAGADIRRLGPKTRVALYGPGARFPSIASLEYNAGTFALGGGQFSSTATMLANTFTTPASLTNVGKVALSGRETRLHIQGDYLQLAGATEVGGTTSMSVDGSLRLAASSQIEVHLAYRPPTQGERGILVQHDAALDGTLRIVFDQDASFYPRIGDHWRIVTAGTEGGALVGRFNNLVLVPGNLPPDLQVAVK